VSDSARDAARLACAEAVTRPVGVAANQELSESTYWRNIDKIKLRYPDDKTARWGHKFEPRPYKWQGWDAACEEESLEEEDGVSVSIASCTCGRCARRMHPQSERYAGAALVSLPALRQVFGISIIAKYQPEHPDTPAHPNHNPCHAVLIPERARLEDLLRKLKLLCLDDWPPKVPTTTADEQKAERCKANWDRVFPEFVLDE
jgi:hypothetical protein